MAPFSVRTFGNKALTFATIRVFSANQHAPYRAVQKALDANVLARSFSTLTIDSEPPVLFKVQWYIRRGWLFILRRFEVEVLVGPRGDLAAAGHPNHETNL